MARSSTAGTAPRARRKRTTWVTATIVAVILLIIGWLVFSRWTSPRLIEQNGVTLLVNGRSVSLERRGDSGDQVGTGGELGLIGGRCVGLVGPSTLLAWPADAELVVAADGSFEVRMGELSLKSGQQVQGAAGTPTETEKLSTSIPQECRGHQILAFTPGQ